MVGHSQSYQVADLISLARSVGQAPFIVECVCDDEVARERLTRGGHVAVNRSFALYTSLKATAEPIAVPKLVLDTGLLSLGECVQRCLAYLPNSKVSGRV